MSLSSTLSTALTGMNATQRALTVVANNVSNASVEGYSRKEVQQSTLIVEGRGVGTTVDDVARVVDEFLNAEHRIQTNLLGRTEEIKDIHTRIQDSILGAPGEGDRGLNNKLNNLATSLETLANTPEKQALRGDVLGAIQDLVSQVGIDADKVQQLRADVDKQISNVVTEVNLDIEALVGINAELARQVSSAELLDRRDALLTSLSEKIDISTLYNDNGTVTVLTASGAPLLEYSRYVMVYEPASAVTDTTTFGAIEIYAENDIDPATGDPYPTALGMTVVSGGVRAELTPELQADGVADADQIISTSLHGGRVAGLLEARDRILPELADQFGEFAAMTRYALNQAHNNAVPSPPPNNLTGSRTDFTGYNAANNSGTAYLAVVDNTTGDVLSTVSIDATQASAAAIVAQLNTDLAGFGTAAINGDGVLEVTMTSADHGIALDEGDSAIQVADDAGHVWDYGVAHYFGLNDLIVSTGSRSIDIDVRSDIQADSSLISNVKLTVDTSGAPVTSTVGGAGDNRGIQQLADALNTEVLSVDRGDLPGASRSIGLYLADTISLTAVTADYARTEYESNKALVDDISFRKGAVSGVNMDEELSKLIIYQQAYTVSARIISVTDEMFDALMSTG